MVQSLQNSCQINVTSSIGTVLQISLLQHENFFLNLKREKVAYRTNKLHRGQTNDTEDFFIPLINF